MNNMIKAPLEWNASQMLRVSVLALALTLTACGGGGGGGGAPTAAQVTTTVTSMVAIGDSIGAADYLLQYGDVLDATPYKNLMDSIAGIV